VRTPATIRIGISGWRYEPWRGVFYPPGLAQQRELEFASRALSTIEINGTFYSLQRPESFRRWRDDTPPGFVFSVKGPRFITHIKRLRDIVKPLANFFASGVLALGDRLGPFLWQFPASQKPDLDLFAAFFAKLPRDTAAAEACARRREPSRMKGRSALRCPVDAKLRHCVEVRNPGFADRAFADLLRAEDIALVVADTAGKWPYLEEVTSDFVYVRLHGDEALYTSGYTDAALDRWAERISCWRRGDQPHDAARIDDAPVARVPRDVYCYFDNDAKVHAPFDAHALARRLGVAVPADAIATRHPAARPKRTRAVARAAGRASSPSER
jgi:uncharacterized protein YecE (DUF72 family)